MISFACKLDRTAFSFDAAFEAGPGVTALFGPSGSGKSTAIRMLAGLERAARGRINVNGETLLDTQRRIFVAPHKRRIGLVFQDAMLFPHLPVKANLAYGRWFTPARDRRIALEPVVDVLGIGHLMDRRPATLSGGERQRVAIGRALLQSPRLLLMDEPLASLDAARKLEILPFIERLRDEFAIPIIYVSHAVEEVARLAAHVVRLERGRVVAAGTPADVLMQPETGPATGRFDVVSILTAPVKTYLSDYGLSVLAHPAGDIVVPGQVTGSTDVRVAVRATSITLALGAPGEVSVRTALKGQIARLELDSGPFALITLALPGGDSLKVSTTRLAVDQLGLAVGAVVLALVKAVAIDERGVPGLSAARADHSI